MLTLEIVTFLSSIGCLNDSRTFFWNSGDSSKNTAIKIVKLSQDLSEQADILDEINTAIIRNIYSSQYNKQEFSNAINDCEKGSHSELMCSPLFEGSVNEYFDLPSN